MNSLGLSRSEGFYVWRLLLILIDSGSFLKGFNFQCNVSAEHVILPCKPVLTFENCMLAYGNKTTILRKPCHHVSMDGLTRNVHETMVSTSLGVLVDVRLSFFLEWLLSN